MELAPHEFILTRPVISKCFICKAPPPFINYPFDGFESLTFGHIVRQEFLLCARCSALLQDNHIATLTDQFIQSGAVEANLNGRHTLRHDPGAFRLDVYGTLVQLAIRSLAKAN